MDHTPTIIQKIVDNYHIKLKQQQKDVMIDCEDVDGSATAHGKFTMNQIIIISNCMLQSSEELFAYLKSSIDKPHIFKITDTRDLMISFEYAVANKIKIKEMIFTLKQKQISEIDCLRIQNQKLRNRLKALEKNLENELSLMKSQSAKIKNDSIIENSALRQQLAQLRSQISQFRSQEINKFDAMKEEMLRIKNPLPLNKTINSSKIGQEWIPVNVLLGQTIRTQPAKIQYHLNAQFGSRTHILAKNLAIYKTCSVPLNPDHPPYMKFMFKIKADSKDNTHYTVFIGVQNQKGQHIPHAKWATNFRDDPMWTIFQEANYYTPASTKFQRRTFEYKPTNDLPKAARFIAFFVLVNHKHTTTQYTLSDYTLHVDYDE